LTAGDLTGLLYVDSNFSVVRHLPSEQQGPMPMQSTCFSCGLMLPLGLLVYSVSSMSWSQLDWGMLSRCIQDASHVHQP
jgi:hypothetical protein